MCSFALPSTTLLEPQLHGLHTSSGFMLPGPAQANQGHFPTTTTTPLLTPLSSLNSNPGHSTPRRPTPNDQRQLALFSCDGCPPPPKNLGEFGVLRVCQRIFFCSEIPKNPPDLVVTFPPGGGRGQGHPFWVWVVGGRQLVISELFTSLVGWPAMRRAFSTLRSS